MNDVIIYRPYRSHGWFVPFTIAIGILAFMAAGFCIPEMGLFDFFLTIGVLSMCVTKVLYDSTNIVIFFEREGMRIAGGRYNNYSFFPWKEFSYVYYAKSFKGHLFAVLSPKALSPKEVKNFVNRSANSSRMCIDFVVAIHIDVLQRTSQLKDLIASHVLYADVY